MMAPFVYRDARMGARWWVQGRVLGVYGSRLDVRVARVFRGPLTIWRRRIDLFVALAQPGEYPLDGRLRWDPAGLDRARYVEAFLDGEPPEVVLDQLKFIPRLTWRPSSDPSIEGFGW